MCRLLFLLVSRLPKGLSLEQAMRQTEDKMQQQSPNSNSAGVDDVDETIELFRTFRPKIEWRYVDQLHPNSRNARTHNRKQRRAIAASIKRLGFNNPILIDRDNLIVAGHGRWEAAKSIGLREVPVIQLDHLSTDEVRAYMLADNQLAALAGWDEEILAIELQHLVEVNFNVDVTGFEAPEVDHFIETQLTGPGESHSDVIPATQFDVLPTSQLEDIWLLGPHQLMCGSALNATYLNMLLEGIRAAQVFTDPPFNVPIDGHVCGSGSIKHKEFPMAVGEMSRDEFLTFLSVALTNAARFTKDGSVHYVFMDWRHIDVLLEASRDIYSELLNICVWNKTNAGMGSFYRSQHEFVAVFKYGSASHMNNIQLGRFGRNRSNVWTYAGVNSLKPDRLYELSMHPTVKPVALVSDAIRDSSKRGDVILDPFMGSGTTIIAAEETGRVAYGMELDPQYVDVIVQRWQNFTGTSAIHAETGLSFAEMTIVRHERVPVLPPPPTSHLEEGQSDE
jgi:DNA modification methylase